jgi:hypothetical protein
MKKPTVDQIGRWIIIAAAGLLTILAILTVIVCISKAL